jgi:glucose/arabinose dehydrogenase/chitodextrinase
MWDVPSLKNNNIRQRIHAERSAKRLLAVIALAGALGLAALVGLRAGLTSAAATWAPGFYSQMVVDGLTNPTAIAWTPDGRMLIALKEGKVLVYQSGQLLATPFIDISDEVNDVADRGLLGLAVDPNFNSNQYVYLLYTYDPLELPGAPNATDGPDGDGQRVARLIRVKANGNVANLATKQVILGLNSTYANIGAANDPDGGGPQTSCDDNGTPVEDCIPSDSTSHTIGSLAFGTDRSLFVSVGDGARFIIVDTRAFRAYDVNSLAGKILRINPDTGQGYTNNPFYGQNGCTDITRNCAKVYATGLRNPFRMKVDPTTNEPYHGNVGWYSWEEINTGRGKNFGWPCWEGNEHQGIYATDPMTSSYARSPITAAFCQSVYSGSVGSVEPPFYMYPHWYNDKLHDASAMAGPVYTGTNLSYPAQYHNKLFIFDYSGDQDWIKYLSLGGGPPQVGTLGEGVSDMVGQYAGPVDLALNPHDGDLYYVVFNGTGPGQVRRIRYAAGNLPPNAVVNATPLYGLPPLKVTFSAQGTSDPEGQALTYAWDFGNGITASTGSTAVVSHTYVVSGVYTAVLTVTDPLSQADNAQAQVIVGNRPPQVGITAPLSGSMHHAGETVVFTGTATDPEDGVLSGTQLQWAGQLHHLNHVHPDQFRATGVSGSFVFPEHGGGEDYWLELCLTTTDSGIPGQGGAGKLTDKTCIPLYMAHEIPNSPPVAMVAATPLTGVVPLTVTFSGAGSYDPEGTPLTYWWDFGNAITATGSITVSHRYTLPGVYTATLTVTDAGGAAASAAQPIRVRYSVRLPVVMR